MALFTRLDEAGAAAIAARFELGPVERCEPLWAGTINSNFRFSTGTGIHFVRINEGAGAADVAYEAALVGYLADRGVPTPRPRWAEVGGRLITVFPWVAGEHRTPGPWECAELGAALARLHLTGGEFELRRDSRYSFQRIVERWRDLTDRTDLPPDISAALAEIAAETAWLNACAQRRAALPTGVIHGDLFPDNVLFDGDRLSALLDFEQASDGTLVYDLAVCLCSWCHGHDFDAARAGALVAGYASLRPLSATERSGLYLEARAAAMRFTVTRITDVALNPDAAAETRGQKDFRHYLARLAQLRELGDAGFAALID